MRGASALRVAIVATRARRLGGAGGVGTALPRRRARRWRRSARRVARLLAQRRTSTRTSASRAVEIGVALAIGGLAGSPSASCSAPTASCRRRSSRCSCYLGPDAEDHLLSGDDHVVRRGQRARRSRWARCRASFRSRSARRRACARSTRVLIRVGRSFRASPWQMVTKIYLPAMRAPIVNGVRLGLGVAIIGTLLAETKLSNRGHRLPHHPGVLAVRHAADVRAADRAVRAGDRRQCADRALRGRVIGKGALAAARVRMRTIVASPGGETGRHKGLKIPRPQGHAGSIPAPGTPSISRTC